MKKILFTISLIGFIIIGFTRCSKDPVCQECTINTTQNVGGFDQTVTVTEDYCDDAYDDAPEEGTVSQNVGGIEQEVTITCSDI